MDFSSASLASLSALPLDWIIIGVLAVALSLESYRAGGGKAVTLAVAMPIAYVCMLWLGATAGLGGLTQQLTSPLALAGLFFTLFSGLFVLIYRMFFAFDAGSGSIVQSVLTGIATTAIILTFWNVAPGVNTLLPLSEPLKLFAGEQYRFYVLFVSYLTLAIARG